MVISVILQLTGIAISRIKRPPSCISVIYTHFRVKLIILLNSACKITCICQVWLKYIKLEFSILPFFFWKNRAFIQNMIRKNNTGTSSESQYFNVTILFHNLEVLLCCFGKHIFKKLCDYVRDIRFARPALPFYV